MYIFVKVFAKQSVFLASKYLGIFKPLIKVSTYAGNTYHMLYD